MGYSLIVFHYRVLVGLKKSPTGGPKISGDPGAGSRPLIAVFYIFTMKNQHFASHMPPGAGLVSGNWLNFDPCLGKTDFRQKFSRREAKFFKKSYVGAIILMT